ncbi:MAG: rhomboid family intramembrane serine protease [Marinifilaceae bacterium]
MNQYRPMLSIPPVVKNLIIINVLFLLGRFVIGDTFGVDLDHILGLHFFKSEYFRPHQIITHMFMHGGIMHLLFNMYALYLFGRVLENVWGPKRFLTYYLVTGLGAAALHTFVGWLDYSSMMKEAVAFSNTPSPELLSHFINEHVGRPAPWVLEFLDHWADNPDSAASINQALQMVNQVITESINIPTVGASGAVFGVLLAFGMLFPNTELMLLFPPIPIKAKYFVIIYGLLELFLGVQNLSGDNVAHFAHLGGMLFGFILIKYWNKNSRNFY